MEKSKEKEHEFSQAELCKLKQAHDRSKEILNHVNEAAKIAFNRARLEDIQRHLDTTYFERTDHAIVNEFKVCIFLRSYFKTDTDFSEIYYIVLIIQYIRLLK